MIMLNGETLAKLSRVFRGHPEIQAVYLFGSAAEGRARAGSDLDLAVVSSSPALRGKLLELLGELARAGVCNVDLVLLDDRDLVLSYEAVRPNKLVYARADFDRGAFYSKVIRKYLDFEPYLKRQREAYKRRVLSGEG